MVSTDAGMAPAFTNSAMAEGTVLISDISAAGADVNNSSAFSTSRAAPPQHRGANNSKTERSKQIEVEANTVCNSSGLNTSRDQLSMATALLCSMHTPFGAPVDPEV